MSESNRHPFLQGLSKHRGAPPTVMVIFGASGDLTKRKLIPAIYNLCVDNLLPSNFYLFGFGRMEIPDREFSDMTISALNEFSRRKFRSQLWEQNAANTFYHAGSYDDTQAFHTLSARLLKIEKEIGRDVQFLFYISTPPTVFKDILQNLGKSGLAEHHKGTPLASKVIIEKPFGRDLTTAQELNKTITSVFDESQVYRIDHYLGKETVQDLLVHRFANSIFEPIWNRLYVDCVQITVAESLGVGSRGGYYNQSGALRDMIQNHTMQLVALTAMEPPVSLDPESIRDEKVKVIKAIQALKLDSDRPDVVRAQYDSGLIEGGKVKSYLEEKDMPQDSFTETYAALKLSINNWRWEGIPFYIRSGKRMARRISEIAIQFKRPPGILFTEGNQFNIASNTLVFQIQPDEGITLLMNSKVPGLQTRTQPVKMHFRYATTFGSDTPEAYERLILDAMIGDSTLFIRGDETEASWKLVTPILEYWQSNGKKGLKKYVAGSWGPAEAEELLNPPHTWRKSGP